MLRPGGAALHLVGRPFPLPADDPLHVGLSGAGYRPTPTVRGPPTSPAIGACDLVSPPRLPLVETIAEGSGAFAGDTERIRQRRIAVSWAPLPGTRAMGDTLRAMVGQLHAGDLIARGNTSDVWRWSPTTVVKVLRPEIPAQWATLEAEITRRVHAAGLPAPATDGVVEVDGRPGVVLERIEGASMWSRMKAAPSELPALVAQLVDIQVTVQAAGPIAGLPDLAGRLHGKIDEADQIARRGAAARPTTCWRGCPPSRPSATATCTRPTSSWRPAAGSSWTGSTPRSAARAADLARSSLLMRPPATPESVEPPPGRRHRRGPGPPACRLPGLPPGARPDRRRGLRDVGGRAGRGPHVRAGPEGRPGQHLAALARGQRRRARLTRPRRRGAGLRSPGTRPQARSCLSSSKTSGLAATMSWPLAADGSSTRAPDSAAMMAPAA